MSITGRIIQCELETSYEFTLQIRGTRERWTVRIRRELKEENEEIGSEDRTIPNAKKFGKTFADFLRYHIIQDGLEPEACKRDDPWEISINDHKKRRWEMTAYCVKL